MKRILFAIVVAASLAGCAQFQQFTGAISALTTSHQNITPTQLKESEDVMTLIFVGLNTYKKSCLRGVFPASCKDVIRSIQVYTRQLPPLLTELRSFVKNNDQVNAATVYAELQRLFGLVKTQAFASGITIGG